MKESKAPSLGRTPAQKFLDKWQGLIYLIPWIIGFVVFGAISWIGPNRNEGFDITYDPGSALGYMSMLGLFVGALVGAVIVALLTYRK